MQRTKASQISIAVSLGLIGVLALLFGMASGPAYGAPLPRPPAEIITGTDTIAHTVATTHQLGVYGDGRIAYQLLNDNNMNQLDEAGDDPNATTLAIRFSQHGSTVDVGAQGEFTRLTPITLNTASDIPGYIEDTQVVYRSQVLSYQVTQRTLAPPDSNWVFMELVIENTGGSSLTNGRLFFMVDLDARSFQNGDVGFYDADRQMAGITDGGGSNSCAVGITLIEGDLHGYRIRGDDNYPTTDADIISVMNSPGNNIDDDSNQNHYVIMVVDLPNPLEAQEATTATFALGAAFTSAGGSDTDIWDDLIDDYDREANFSAAKTATPSPGSLVVAGEPITYRISIARLTTDTINSVLFTDTIPPSTTLLSYSLSQGSITAAGGQVTADIGQINSDTPVYITMTVAPFITAPTGTVVNNQAQVQGSIQITTTPITLVKQTNAVTHSVSALLPLTLSKSTINNWPKRQKLTFDNLARSENLVDFPVLVKLNSSRIDYSLTQDAGQDLRFVDASGALLPHEIEQWDESGDSYVWVKVNQIDALTDTDYIWMYYGNSLTPDGQQPEAVWSNGYRGVWHLHNDLRDSSPYGNHCANFGTVDKGGQIGDGQQFDGTDIFIDCGADSSLDILENATLSVWAKISDTNSSWLRLISKKWDWQYAGYGMETNPDNQTLTLLGGSLGSPLGVTTPDLEWDTTTWRYLAGVISHTGATYDRAALYFDGVDRTNTNNVNPIEVSTVSLRLGHFGGDTPRDFFYGTLDEARVAAVVRSADWISAQHQSMSDNFITFGPVEDIPAQLNPVTTAGQPFTYTLTLTNPNPAELTNLIVTDAVPTDAHFIAAQNGGQLLPGDVVSWTAATIPANDGHVQLSYVVSSCEQTVINDAYRVVTSTEGVTSAVGSPLLSLLAPPYLTPSLSFSPAPAGISKTVSFTGSGQTNGSPIVAYGWDFGDGQTAAGATAGHIYTAAGTYTVTLSITDSCDFVETATQTLVVYPPLLTVTKQVDPDPVEVGQRLTYTIVISNGSGADATDVTISDTLPASTTFATGSLVLDPPGGSTGPPPTLARDLTITGLTRLTLTYQVTVAAGLTDGTILTNTVSITVAETPTPTTAVVTGAVRSRPELHLTKSSTAPAPLQPGDRITYTIVVTNGGSGPAAALTITDQLPTDTTFAPGSINLTAPDGGSAGTAPPTLAYDVEIQNGGRMTVTFAVTVNTSLTTGIAIANTALVTGTDLISGASDTVTDTVTGADLAIAKWSDSSPATPGQTLTYTLTITNAGPGDAADLIVTDTLPAAVAYSDAAGSGWSCGHTGGVVTCTRSLLPVGVAPAIVITVTAPISDGTITNTATVTAASLDPLTANNDDAITTTVTLPSLSLAAAAYSVSESVGQAVLTVTLDRTPFTTATAKYTTADDTALAGSDYTAVGGTLQFGPGVTALTFTVPITDDSLDETDESFTVTLSDFSAAQAGSITKTTVTILDDDQPILAIGKQRDAAYVGPGDTIEYTIVVSNNGTGTTTDARIWDTLPANANFVTGSISLEPATAGTTGSTPPLLAYSLTLSAGENLTVTYRVTAGTGSDPITNTASLSAPLLAGPIQANIVTSTVILTPTLTFKKEGPATAAVGQTAAFTFTVAHSGTSAVDSLVVSDTIAGAAAFRSGDANNNSLLDANESWVYTAPYTFRATDTAVLQNIATLSGQNQDDGSPIVMTATHITFVRGYTPTLFIDQDGPITATIGETIALTFTVINYASNPGGASGLSAGDGSPISNLVITDSLLNSIAYLSGDANSNNRLDRGETWRYTALYTVQAGDPDPLNNQVFIQGQDPEGDPVNATDFHKIYLDTTEDKPKQSIFLPVILKR